MYDQPPPAAERRADAVTNPVLRVRNLTTAFRRDDMWTEVIRNISFHFAMRSDRVKLPTFSCPAFQPVARCAMVTSSLSPERAETIAPQPRATAASSAAFASVTVPT